MKFHNDYLFFIDRDGYLMNMERLRNEIRDYF